MKMIGESLFDIAYLVFAIGMSIWIIIRNKNQKHLLMGIAALVLGAGDAFHLVPRMLDYFVSADMSFYLGVGKMITSVTMTLFYVLLYHIYLLVDGAAERPGLSVAVYALALIRVLICMAPGNGWVSGGSVEMGVYRNIPFLVLGIIVIIRYFSIRDNRWCRYMWLYMTLSFLFYIPVVVGASAVPMLGMLMLPKTVCYALMILSFFQEVRGAGRSVMGPDDNSK